MTARGSGREPAEHRRDVESNTDRATGALENARKMAARLASTARDLAATYDRLAETREARADQGDAEQRRNTREAARRSRENADRERRDAQELQEKWNLPRD
jgi:hypothetical protein